MKILKCLAIIAVILALTLSVYGTDIVIPTCHTLEEFYEHQATKGELPQPFVGYDALKPFGDFNRYEYSFGPYTSGRFFLIDANGHDIFIDINYPGSYNFSNPKKGLQMEKSMTDMRTHPSGMSGTVRHNKIDYYYANGILSSISWKIANITFTLAMGRKAGAYPLDAETTPISRLLSTEKATAYSVVEELADAIDPDGSYRAAYTAKIWLKAIAAVLIVPSPIVLTVSLLNHRSRKRRRLTV